MGRFDMADENKVRVHIKNNHAALGTFPPTPEGEEVFTITRERYLQAAERHPEVAKRLDVFIDWDLDNFAESMKTADILVTWDLPTAHLAAVAPNLKWIHVIGAGVEHLCPMDWLPHGVTVVNNKGAHAAKAGDFGLMSILMLHTRLAAIAWNQRQAKWDSLYSTPIAGSVVVVIGVGSIGGAVARNLKHVGAHVIGVSRHGKPHPGVDESVASDRLDEVLPRADYVFVATPATPETANLLNRDRLSRMKPGAGLVNVGRACVVDYDALRDLLVQGRLSGAVLNVFDPEPLPADSPLWNTPNLIVTPHISADDGDAYVPITLDLFFENVRRYLAGEPLRNVVRPDLGY